MADFKHFLADKDLSREQLLRLIDKARDIKARPRSYAQALSGKSIVMLFEKQSLRTRVTFDIGINKLGGHAVYLDQQNGALGVRESVRDFGANISQWADGIVARGFQQSTLDELVLGGTVPVVNALSDLYHPCQALADFMTLTEVAGDPTKVKLAYVGDGNNVTHSLMHFAARLGAEMVVCCPRGHSVDGQVVVEAQLLNAESGGSLVVTDDLAALEGVDAIYGDTWISMGDNTPYEQVMDTFMPYQVNEALMARSGARFYLHCQPAHREMEVSSAVMDGPQSVILPQAQNRMWAQNAVLLELLG